MTAASTVCRAGWRPRVVGLIGGVVALSAFALLPALPVRASVMIAREARDASLRVDASGNAEVDWIASEGRRLSVVIDRGGAMHYGAGIGGGDVSDPVSTTGVPWAVVVRRTGDGSLYALQSWRRLDNGPVELRFSRWRGEPTLLTLQAVCCKWHSENVQGNASFHGRPIYGFKATRQGNPLDPYGRNVYLDAYRAGRWERMMGILANAPTGSFSLWIRPSWLGSAYRGTIPGPNWGWTLGPDASAQTTSSRSSTAAQPAAAATASAHAGRAGPTASPVPGTRRGGGS